MNLPLLAGLVAVALVLPVLARRWSARELRAVRREFRARIDRYKRTSRHLIRQDLLADPELAEAVREHAARTKVLEAESWARVREYLDEILPSFNLLSYYRFGYAAARVLVPLFYRVSVDFEARAALDAMPRDAVVLFLINHRSNADYVVVAYVTSSRVAISWAVGEWARVWPLETVFKSFGSYMVRRRFREPLYHKVLERYIQLITRNGVTQGIFLEGGLTRDGRFREPKLGLLDYLLRAKRDPSFTRPLRVVPVALNYDRVLEDRSLLRESQSEDERLPRGDQVREVVSYVTKVSLRFLTRRARRYGRACVSFGAPLDVDAWLAARPGLLDLPREERLPRVKELADEVMGRIAAIMPVTAVALACTALLEHRAEAVITREAWRSTLDDLRFVLRGRKVAVLGDEHDSEALLERALVMLTLRRVVRPEAGGFGVDWGEEPLLRYYANSIAHYFA